MKKIIQILFIITILFLGHTTFAFASALFSNTGVSNSYNSTIAPSSAFADITPTLSGTFTSVNLIINKVSGADFYLVFNPTFSSFPTLSNGCVSGTITDDIGNVARDIPLYSVSGGDCYFSSGTSISFVVFNLSSTTLMNYYTDTYINSPMVINGDIPTITTTTDPIYTDLPITFICNPNDSHTPLAFFLSTGEFIGVVDTCGDVTIDSFSGLLASIQPDFTYNGADLVVLFGDSSINSSWASGEDLTTAKANLAVYGWLDFHTIGRTYMQPAISIDSLINTITISTPINGSIVSTTELVQFTGQYNYAAGFSLYPYDKLRFSITNLTDLSTYTTTDIDLSTSHDNFSFNLSALLPPDKSFSFIASFYDSTDATVPVFSSYPVYFSTGIPTGGIVGGIQEVVYATCSDFNFLCHFKNIIQWAFGVDTNVLNQFKLLQLSQHVPFSYIYDVQTLFYELFGGNATSFSLSIPFMGHTLPVISTAMLEDIPFQPLVRTAMGALLIYLMVMTIYKKIITMFDANNKIV